MIPRGPEEAKCLSTDSYCWTGTGRKTLVKDGTQFDIIAKPYAACGAAGRASRCCGTSSMRRDPAYQVGRRASRTICPHMRLRGVSTERQFGNNEDSIGGAGIQDSPPRVAKWPCQRAVHGWNETTVVVLTNASVIATETLPALRRVEQARGQRKAATHDHGERKLLVNSESEKRLRVGNDKCCFNEIKNPMRFRWFDVVQITENLVIIVLWHETPPFVESNKNKTHENESLLKLSHRVFRKFGMNPSTVRRDFFNVKMFYLASKKYRGQQGTDIAQGGWEMVDDASKLSVSAYIDDLVLGADISDIPEEDDAREERSTMASKMATNWAIHPSFAELAIHPSLQELTMHWISKHVEILA
ncbi:hypothetical protein HYPSUDRAFT_58681 [Hypholoma sublateritium FD-334 SS-4]|uniref:Uncharacterized protein n=1 Tax=Hypholoma sublateritium (strain FD-334 SS-4) TaxID=945553 RepID=A0A0D2NGC8_HYPSF|nr:hypothetical protein HYPSUDRAFT_58681 [Hypholoma sublateritium FD-334 SS-4]